MENEDNNQQQQNYINTSTINNNQKRTSNYTRHKWDQAPTSQISATDQAQTVSFLFATDQYIDPKTAYLLIEIELNPAYYDVEGNGLGGLRADSCEGLALDGPTTALIDSLKITQNGRIIELIQGYNHVGQLLSDLNLMPDARHNRSDLGYESDQRFQQQKSNPLQNQCNQMPPTYVYPGQNLNVSTGPTQSYFMPNFNPIMYGMYNTGGRKTDIQISYVGLGASQYKSNLLRSDTVARGFPTPNDLYAAYGSYQPAQTSNAAFLQNLYSGTYGVSSVEALNFNYALQAFTTQFFDGASYHTPLNNRTSDNSGNTGTNYGRAFAKRAGYDTLGWQIPYSPYIQNQNRDQLLLPGHATINMVQGCAPGIYKWNTATTHGTTAYATSGSYNFQKWIPPLAKTVYKFKVPIISSFIGIMATGFNGLIDGALLGQLKFEWRLNPTAFYTTGGKTTCVKDNWSNISVANDLLKRDYTIKSVRMIFDTYHPAYTPKEALGPTEFWSNAWLLSFEKILANSKLLQNEHQLNIGLKSVRVMLTRFLSDEYKTYSYCRQQFKLSGNITSYQIKLGSLQFPPQPITGHAGNAGIGSSVNLNYNNINVAAVNSVPQNQYSHVITTADNQPFIDEFNQVLGSFMDLSKYQYFDNVSFAVNQRFWNPLSNLGTLGYEKVNGIPYLLEQCVGKAMYITRFDNFDGMIQRNIINQRPEDFGWLGIDTHNLKPFVLSLESDQNIFFESPLTMQIFFYIDLYVKFTPQGIVMYGGQYN